MRPGHHGESRFEISWGRAATRWVAITDRRTGERVVARDHASWDAALRRAVAEMGRRFTTGS